MNSCKRRAAISSKQVPHTTGGYVEVCLAIAHTHTHTHTHTCISATGSAQDGIYHTGMLDHDAILPSRRSLLIIVHTGFIAEGGLINVLRELMDK